jgi:hypothetical protein
VLVVRLIVKNDGTVITLAGTLNLMKITELMTRAKKEAGPGLAVWNSGFEKET